MHRKMYRPCIRHITNWEANDPTDNSKTTGVEVLVHTGEISITVEQVI
ncbi:MAG TPA: hypothetical protein H9845_01700 [Candidatus Agathobaculum pullicola]|nr:hypothetical protein [Candidatus Agathobaculum pullicola]